MIEEDLNPFQVLIIQDKLHKQNVKYYDMRKGNNCIWVSYNGLETYWIFNNSSELIDVQFD